MKHQITAVYLLVPSLVPTPIFLLLRGRKNKAWYTPFAHELVFPEISQNQDIYLDTYIVTFHHILVGGVLQFYEKFIIASYNLLPVTVQSADMVLAATYQLEKSRFSVL